MFAFSAGKAIVHESKTASTAQAIADELAKAPSCRRVVFETGRMAPILFHGLSPLGFPVIRVESRQAYLFSSGAD
jgi:transposase